MKPKRAFFLSDAHLGHHGKAIEEGKKQHLRAFLHHLEANDTLFLLGDLFDFWYEYRSAIPRHHSDAICMLRHRIENGVHIRFVPGNHDFGVGRFFFEELGIPVLRRSSNIEWEGKRLFVAHGDGLVRRDRGIRFLRVLMRNPVSMGLFRCIHPDIGFAMARFLSKLSRDYKPTTNRDAEYRAFAEGLFAGGIDFVVLGHTHRPDEWRSGSNAYVNTGDWMESFTYAKLENHDLRLHYWVKEHGSKPQENIR